VKNGALWIRTDERIPGGIFLGLEWSDLNRIHPFILIDEIQERFLNCALIPSPSSDSVFRLKELWADHHHNFLGNITSNEV